MLPNTQQQFEVASFSQQLIAVLQEKFDVNTYVAEPIMHLLEHPGKGLRPELAFAVAEACGRDHGDAIFAVAAAGELLHLASMIHDDLIDGATKRRGVAALHQAFDPKTAVLTGDYMLGAACALLSMEASEGTLRRLGPAVHALAEAELLEVRARGQYDDVELAKRIAIGKTGALFGWLAAASAIECREWSGDAAWNQWGQQLGILFQVADDLGDRLEIDEGKDVGLDLETQTPTVVEALLQKDPSGALLVREIEQLAVLVQRPPADGQRLAKFIELITGRALDRLAKWRSVHAA